MIVLGQSEKPYKVNTIPWEDVLPYCMCVGSHIHAFMCVQVGIGVHAYLCPYVAIRSWHQSLSQLLSTCLVLVRTGYLTESRAYQFGSTDCLASTEDPQLYCPSTGIAHI